MSRRESQSGASLVEAAFVLPVFFLLFIGLVDFGMFAFDGNRASNAARDGARVGIIGYEYLDPAGRALDPKPAGSKDYDVLRATIQQNLPGRVVTDADLEVKCLGPDNDVTAISCRTARVDIDRVSVRVRWNRRSISPISALLGFNNATVDGTSRMTIIGRAKPNTSGNPIPCTIVPVVPVIPDPVTRVASEPKAGELQSDLTVTVTGTGTCVAERVRLVAPDGSTAQLCFGGCVGAHVYPRDQDNFWTAGTAYAQVLDISDAVLASTPFVVIDPSVPPPCVVTGVSVSPNPVQRVLGGTRDGELVDNLIVNVSGSGSCTSLSVRLEAPNGSSVVSCSGSCLGNHGYLATQNNFWTAGTAQVEVSGEAIAASTFTVTDAPPCSVTVSVEQNPADVTKQNVLDNYSGKVRQRVTVAATGPCNNLVVSMTPPSGSDTVTLCSGACVGTHEYTSNAPIWAPVSGSTGTATVNVTGSGSARTTFQVRK